MNKKDNLSVLGKAEFKEASLEELRVLVAWLESGETSPERLSELCGISKARAKSSLVFWTDAGVINEAPTITEEFEARLKCGEIAEESSKSVAEAIRSSELADMISECAAIMKRSAFNTAEIKNLTGLHEQYRLSADYITTLAAYLAEKYQATGKSFTVSKLTNKAMTLAGKDVNTTEALEEYIRRAESENAIEREFRRLFGIYDRALTPTEKAYFKRWSEEYGYFTEIVGEAYDISVHAISKLSYSYIEKILKGWHEAGCRTVAECRRQRELEMTEKAKAAEEKKAAKAKKPAESKPRYGDFDINDAFQKALARSFDDD